MNGTRPDAWSVQTGIDLDAMLAANAGWIERVRRKTKRDYQRDKPVLQRVFESLRTKYEAGQYQFVSDCGRPAIGSERCLQKFAQACFLWACGNVSDAWKTLFQADRLGTDERI